MPVALRSAFFAGSASSCDRSSPFDGGAAVFLAADLVPAPLGLEGRAASSWARRAAFSAFLRWASAALSSAAALFLRGLSVSSPRLWRG